MPCFDGRWSRAYKHSDGYLHVTYHRRVRGRLRQLSVSPRLLRRVLR